MIDKDIKRNKYNDFNESEALINQVSLYMHLLEKGTAASVAVNDKGISKRTFQRYLAHLKYLGAVPQNLHVQSAFDERANKEYSFVQCDEMELIDNDASNIAYRYYSKLKGQSNYNVLVNKYGEPAYVNGFYNISLPTDIRLARLCTLYYIQTAFKQNFFNDNFDELEEFYQTQISPGLSRTTFVRDRDALKLAIAGAFCDPNDPCFTDEERKYFNRY